MLRYLLSLILIFAIGAPSFADTLVERGADYNKYQVSANTYRVEIGGDNENALPFDGGGYTPWNLRYDQGTPVGNWVWLGKGTQGYLVKPSLSIVRVYPVRGDQTKFIEISPISVQPSIVNQIDDKHLELYVDQTYSRWSLKMTPQGFKSEILLKPGWSGTPEWQFRFELNGGLTLSGAWIMDGTTRVLKMHNPFITDANGTISSVSETLSNGVATLTADMSGVVLPATVDPTLGPIADSKDTILYSLNPTTGYGQYGNVEIYGYNLVSGRIGRGLWQWDISAIPATATVTSATMTLVKSTFFDGGNFEIIRCTRTDWEDASGSGAEANWNNYKDPNVAWPEGPGALGNTDATVKDTYTETVGAGTSNISVINNAQDAVSNRSGIMSMLHKYVDEVSGSQKQGYASQQNGTAENRPKLTVVYTVPVSTDINTHLGYKQMVF